MNIVKKTLFIESCLSINILQTYLSRYYSTDRLQSTTYPSQIEPTVKRAGYSQNLQ